MARIEQTVFISYRRKDISWALAVYQYLSSQKYDVFFDFSSLSSGDFEQVIVSNIRARAHFVLILTPAALDRCSEPGDWLRREIETAIDEKRNIIPLFLDGFNFGSPSVIEKLTGKLGAIQRYNGLDIPSGYFMEAMVRLSNRYLNVPLDAVIHPISTEVRKVVKDEKVAANNALIQRWEDIKELVKPAKEEQGEEKIVTESSSPIGRGVRGDGGNPKLRLYGIGAGILLLAMLGIFGVISLFQNLGGKETPISTFTTNVVSISTMTSLPTTQTRLAPTTTSAPVSLTSTPIPPHPSNWVTYYSDLNGNRDIFELNPATGEKRAVIIDPSHDKVGTWSPEGEFLAFESNRNSTIYYQIYLFDVAEGRVTGLTELAECSNWSPAWSPDGKKIVFYSNCENDRRDIYIMNRDGSGRNKLTSSSGDNKFPAFSPDGNIITFTSTRNGGNQILLMNSDGSNQRVITDGCSSTFSPDGNWLWFSTNCDDSDIKRIRITGTNLSTIGTKFGHNPSLSPDGLFVVFQSYDDIWMMGVDGSNPTQLTSESALDGAPSWKP